jgi:hypothetical protein
MVAELQAAGARSLRDIAAGLNTRGVRTRVIGEWKAGTSFVHESVTRLCYRGTVTPGHTRNLKVEQSHQARI